MNVISMTFTHPLMAPVVELALKAGEAILPFWRANVTVTSKADDSPVTAADIAAHHVIVAGLTALDSTIPILSEEDADIPQSVRAGWQRWWLVDPLDGTKEFINGSEEFTVNIALIENGRVVFGVVSMPTNGRFLCRRCRARCVARRSGMARRLAIPGAGRSLAPGAVVHRGGEPPAFQSGAGALCLAGWSASLGRTAIGEHRQFAEVLPAGGRGGGLLSASGADFAVGHGGGAGRAGRGGRRGAGSAR
jgi:hypothetical protein